MYIKKRGKEKNPASLHLTEAIQFNGKKKTVYWSISLSK